MARYLISFDRGWMDFPEEDLPDVARDARAVVQECADAGAFVFTSGLATDERAEAQRTLDEARAEHEEAKRRLDELD